MRRWAPAWPRRSRSAAFAGATVSMLADDTAIDPETGAVTSRQGADVFLPAAEVEERWDAEHLERVARAYWTTLSRFTLGLMRVHYSETERSVVLLFPRLRLLTFHAPEYEMDRRHGLVRWRIARGVLVSRRGRGGDGYLELDVQRHEIADADRVRLRIVVEVANYYPALTGLSRWVYVNTQARIHVFACSYFLRRLIRRDLPRSRVGAHIRAS